MSHDHRVTRRDVADLLAADIAVRGFTLVGNADGLPEFDVELERDEPVAELCRRLTPLTMRPVAERRSVAAPGAEPLGEPRRCGRQTGIMALIGPPEARASEKREPTATLGRTLWRAATEGANEITVIDSDGGGLSLTWAGLLDIALREGERLRSAMTGRSGRVLIAAVEPSATLIAFWACVMADLDPLLVPAELLTTDPADIESWMGLLRAELDLALIARQPDTATFVGAEWDRMSVDGPGLVTIDVTPATADPEAVLRRRDAWCRGPGANSDSERTVAFMTSGSTGRPKVVAQRHAAILSVAAGSAWMNGLDARDVSLNWMPLSHVGGILMTLVRDVHIGARHISVATSRILADPEEWFEIVHRHRVTATWSPNFGLKLLARTASRIQRTGASRYDVSSLNFYLNGGEAVSAADIRLFDQRLAPFGLRPGTVTPAWGMTETCSGVVYATDLDADTVTPGPPSVGFPLPGTEVRIVPLEEQRPEGPVLGHLEVRGPSVMERYAVPAEAGGQDAQGWFRTGDVGWIADDGLHISGREDGQIIINGVNWNAADIESAVEQAPGIVPGTAAAVGHDTRESGTQDLLIFCAAAEGVPPDQAADAVRSHVYHSLRIGVRRVIVVDPSAIERTSIGKIKKRRLAERFAGNPANPGPPEPSSVTPRARLIWARDLPAKAPVHSSMMWLEGPETEGPETSRHQGEQRQTVVIHGEGLSAGAGSAQSLLDLCRRWQSWLDRHLAWLRPADLITLVVRHSAESGDVCPLASPLASWLRAALSERGFRNVRVLWVAEGTARDRVDTAVGIADLRDRCIDSSGRQWTRSLLPFPSTGGKTVRAHVVLLGGTGRLGSALAAGLTADGHMVTVVGRRAAPGDGTASARLTGDVSTAQGAEVIVRALAGGREPGIPLRLVHLAGSPDDRDAAKDELLDRVLRPKIEGIRNSRAMAERLGVPLTVISSVNAHLGGAGIPYYAAACAAAEAACAGTDTEIIACSMVEKAKHSPETETVAQASGIRAVSLRDLMAALTAEHRPGTCVLGLASRNRYLNEEGAYQVRMSVTPPEQDAPRADPGRSDEMTGQLAGLVTELFPEADADTSATWFDRGLNSVSLPLLARGIGEQVNVEVSIVDLMRYPSVTTLAPVLAERIAAGQGGEQ